MKNKFNKQSIDIHPLIVSPAQACVMLSIGLTQCYMLMNTGKLESFKDGGSRKIPVKSIEAYVESRLRNKEVTPVRRPTPTTDFEDINNEDDPIEEITRLQTIIQQEKEH
jgi:excisionase family DNA binding protein